MHIIFDIESEEEFEIIVKQAEKELEEIAKNKIIEKKFVKIDKLRNRIHKIKLGEFAPDEIFEKVGEKKKSRFTINSKIYTVRMDSSRYFVFKDNLRCVACGIEGTKMILEKQSASTAPHFNLYAEENGDNILMTKDHIVAKANGGENDHSNYQTMCSICNNLKGSAHISLNSLRKLRKLYDDNKKTTPKRKLSNLIVEARKKLK